MQSKRSFSRDKRGISPAISTVILTSAIIVMIMVAMTFANGVLNSQVANNEFTSNKQFMQTTGQQLDAVAWSLGGTQTVTYSSKYGALAFNASALYYSFQLYSNSTLLASFNAPATGLIMYNMPVSAVSVGNGYFQRVPMNANSSIVQSGASAPVSQVLCMENLTVGSHAYSRIVLVPTIRMLNSTIMGTASYYKFYVPYLDGFSTTHASSPSITLTGENVTKITETGVTRVVVTAVPNVSAGFDSTFFRFNSTVVAIPTILSGSVVEFYFGEVQVTQGVT